MKKLHLISTLIFALFASVAATAQTVPADSLNFDEDPYFLLMGEADDAISRQDWPEAAARLSDALAVKPDAPTNPLLLNNLATVYTYMGRDSIALATYDRALEMAPAMTTTLLGRAKLLLKSGRDVSAYRDFETVIELDSINTDARYYHGMMSLYAGGLETAEQDFRVLNTVAPKAYNTSLALATLYSLTGRDRLAIPYLENLIESDPAAEYFASLAGCHLAIGDLTAASETIARGMLSFPEDPELFYYRAWLNRDRYRLDDAHADAERAIALGASPARVNDLFKK